ncbi:CMRF35-like molecule 1 isoform X2 [Ctenopharyngodon idella]|uniref:CMRF35-like molecule 1 isoform X2 n=1 Tax=Ctenopharyngodon idella TaxID=7959 RepID=UPI00222E3435|nr:CMRF35-like molecule 1 isoform X2 [Ctenopharyngodon idella]
MWDVLLLFSSICTAVVVGAPDTVTGHRGERVEIRCSYESGYESNSKYFCKGECTIGNKIIMVESGSAAKDERFSLTDNTTNRVFTITITDLRTEDEGQYWCAVKRTLNTDVYSEIVLLVKEDKNTTEVSTISSFSKTQLYFSTTELNPQSVSHQTESETTRTTTGNTTVELDQPTTMMRSDLVSVAGGLGSVLLVLTLCSGTFLILKKRKRKCGTALFQQNVQHNTETDRMYEEIPNSDVATVTSSSNQTPESHHPEVSAVYARVIKQQPDSNPGHTHSTNQVHRSQPDPGRIQVRPRTCTLTRPQRSPEVSAEIESTRSSPVKASSTRQPRHSSSTTVHTGVMNTILNWMELK